MLSKVFILEFCIMYFRRISLQCTTKSNCFRSRPCMITSPLSPRVSYLHLLPTRVLCCIAPILTILFHSQLTCGLDPTVSPIAALLLTGSLLTGSCSMLCWTSYFALTATPVKIWWSGSSKYCAQMIFVYDQSYFCFAWFLIDCSFFLFFAASWRWSSDSWSWRWRDESSATKRYPWLSMLWSWTRSHRQCWSRLPRFRSMFIKASNVVSTIRSSNNLYRELRDDQVRSVSMLFLIVSGFISFLFVKLEMWTEYSVRPVLPTQFVRTRWHSKYGMLKSLLANKRSVRRMAASDDDCCSALHDQDLSDAEWQIIEVSVCFQSR